VRSPWRRLDALRALAATAFGVLATYAGDLIEASDLRAVVPVEVFVVHEHGAPVVSRDWLDAQVAHANRLFWPAQVGFEIERAEAISARYAHIASRAERDALADAAPPPGRTPGRVHLFVVRQLDDVDIEGNLLYGVHWRLRRDRGQTWIIMSTRDTSSTVFAHELGHLFELPHSRYPESIMNKSPHLDIPWPERVFAEPELRRIRGQARRHLESRRLIPIDTPRR
jgi:hypothetical protein